MQGPSSPFTADGEKVRRGDGETPPHFLTFTVPLTKVQKAFEDSVEDYLAFCAERGEEPDKPFSGRFAVRLSPEQHRKVILAAEKAGEGIERWVRGSYSGCEFLKRSCAICRQEP